MRDWGQKRELSLGVRILLQVLRYALAALFFYIAYLGIIWRQAAPPPAPPDQQRARPAPSEPPVLRSAPKEPSPKPTEESAAPSKPAAEEAR
jgi:hypothetical protein